MCLHFFVRLRLPHASYFRPPVVASVGHSRSRARASYPSCVTAYPPRSPPARVLRLPSSDLSPLSSIQKASPERINGEKINQGTRMLKLIAIMTGCCLALAVSVQAAKPVEEAAAKKPAPKSKPVQKQHMAPNTHVQTLHTEHANVHNKVNTNGNKNEDTSVNNNVNAD